MRPLLPTAQAEATKALAAAAASTRRIRALGPPVIDRATRAGGADFLSGHGRAARPGPFIGVTSTSGGIRIAVVGLGKMGLSHLAIVNAHPELEVAAVCDASSYVLGVLKKYTGVATYGDYERMLRELELDAVLIATPSRTHAAMVRAALERGLHVFCEKPFTLSVEDAEELTALARDEGVVTQVGYHNRFVGPFAEVKRLLDAGAIGTVTHASARPTARSCSSPRAARGAAARRRAAARSTTTPRIR